MIRKIDNLPRFLRRKKVEEMTGLPRSTIYDRVRKGTFPAPLDLGGGHIVAWLESDVIRWMEERIKASRSKGKV